MSQAVLDSPGGWLGLIDGFERALQRRRLSPETVRTYRVGILDLQRFLGDQGCDEVRDVTVDILERWQDTLGPRVRATTSSTYSTAVRRLLHWAGIQGLVDSRLEHAIGPVKTVEGRPRPIPPLDLALIKAYLLPKWPHMGIVALRDRALFFYLLTTGARVSEALQAPRDNFVSPAVRQKGGTEKVLRIPPATIDLVSDYVHARRDDSPWLWISHKTNAPLGRLGPPGVREVLRKLAAKLGIPPFTTHQLRHTCATELRKAKVPDLAVVEKLGHHDLGSLHIYGEVQESERELADEAMQKLVSGSRPALLPRLSAGSRW